MLGPDGGPPPTRSGLAPHRQRSGQARDREAKRNRRIREHNRVLSGSRSMLQGLSGTIRPTNEQPRKPRAEPVSAAHPTKRRSDAP